MSVSSTVILSRKVSLVQYLAIFLFIVLGSAAAVSGAGDMMFDRYSVQNNDYEPKDYYIQGGNGKSLVNALDRAGILDIIRNLVPEVVDLLVKLEKLFHALDEDRHRHIHDLNKVLGHIKDTWTRSLDEMTKEKGPMAVVDVNAFRAFLDKYKVLLNRAINSDGLQASDVVKFMDYLDHLLRSLEAAYAVVFFGLKDLGLPFQLTWSLLAMTKRVIYMIPANLFDADMLGELMQTPKELMSQLTSGVELFHKTIEEYGASAYFSIAVNMIQNFITQQQQKRQHDINRSEM